jgi:hypothetical protein
MGIGMCYHGHYFLESRSAGAELIGQETGAPVVFVDETQTDNAMKTTDGLEREPA